MTEQDKLKPEEIPWKRWLSEEAQKMGIPLNTLRERIRRGTHPSPRIRKVNRRVWFVNLSEPDTTRDVCKACGEPWIMHPGIQVTCDRHQIALNCLDRIASGKKNTLDKRLAVSTLSLLRHCK